MSHYRGTVHLRKCAQVCTLGLTLQQHHSGLCNKGRKDHLKAMQHNMD